MSLEMRCAKPSCPETTGGIYCPTHRDERANRMREVAAERANRMKEAWEADPEGMRERLVNGKAAKSAAAKETVKQDMSGAPCDWTLAGPREEQ
jgi:hypothetical protein